MCTLCGPADEAGEVKANRRGPEAKGKRSRLSQLVVEPEQPGSSRAGRRGASPPPPVEDAPEVEGLLQVIPSSEHTQRNRQCSSLAIKFMQHHRG